MLGIRRVFHENIYTYSDMVSISHGKHNFKVGVDFRRNIENSEFNVARPSYYFTDYLYFAADSPYTQSAGVDPGITDDQGPFSQQLPALAQPGDGRVLPGRLEGHSQPHS